MASSSIVRIEMPSSLKRYRFPKALDRRLHVLLDKQDRGEKLTPEERREAEGLVDMAELVSLLKSRVELANRRSAVPS